jgi:tetratricopeptide (TPR) repeat protein
MDASRDPEEYRLFLELATEDCEANPDDRRPWNYRGYAHYRLGQYAESLTALERAHDLATRAGESPVLMNRVFLAMTQHQLGRRDEARRILVESAEVVKGAPTTFRPVFDEAESLLGIKLETPASSPAKD